MSIIGLRITLATGQWGDKRMPTLKEVIRGIASARIVQGDENCYVSKMAMDSRKVEADCLFACVPGANADGHDYAQAAVDAGAAALLVERVLPLAMPQIQVESTRRILGLIAANIYEHPSEKLEIIGVTGTNGKTTITHLIEKIGTKQGYKVGLIGTLGTRINGREIPGSRTTPEAVEIQGLLAQMVAEDVNQVVMEVSSHALELGRVQGCEFDAAIFTNLTQDHLDFHQNMEEYLTAKSRLFSELKGKKTRSKAAILNADDPACEVLARVSVAPVIRYGIDNPADYRASNVEMTADGVSFTVDFNGGSQRIVYSTPGYFSVYNALAAFAWGVERGYAPKFVAGALAEVPGVPGRFETIRSGQPFQVIVDYAHTPDGLKNVLRTAKEFTSGRLIAVFGCGGDRDRSKRPVMGEIASAWGDYVFVTSDNPRTEEPVAIIKEILVGVHDVDYTAVTDRRQAIKEACARAKPGDTVLIAGKGHETYQIIGKEVFPFDDREEARIALRGLGYGSVD